MFGWLCKVLMIAHIRYLLLINGIRVWSGQIMMRIAGNLYRSRGYSIACSWRVSRSRRWLIVRGKGVIRLEALLHRRQSVLLVGHMLMGGDQSKVQARELVCSIEIRFRIVVIEIQIHGLRFVTRRRDLKVRTIELQVLKVVEREAGFLDMCWKRGLRVSNVRRWWTILDLGWSLGPPALFGALDYGVWWLSAVSD